MSYAFGADQLRKIADLIESTKEGHIADDLYATIIINDIEDSQVMGKLTFDEHGGYGFVPAKSVADDFA